MNYLTHRAVKVLRSDGALVRADLCPGFALTQPRGKLIGRLLGIEEDGAFPHYNDTPARAVQTVGYDKVALPIGKELGVPESGSRLRKSKVTAVPVTVPKAPVDKHHCPPLGQYQVRLSGKSLGVKAETKSARPEQLSHNPFRLCVLRTDSRHQC